MNTLNSKTNGSNRFIYQFTDKLNLKNPTKNMTLANLSIYYTWKNIKSEYKNNKFKISAPTWNKIFTLDDGSYVIEQIQDYFEYIINKQLGKFITITPHSLTMLKTTNAEFSFSIIWFTDQNNRPIEIEDNMNITLMIGISYYKNDIFP